MNGAGKWGCSLLTQTQYGFTPKTESTELTSQVLPYQNVTRPTWEQCRVKNRLSRQCCNILSFLAGHTCSGRLLWLGDFGQREHGGRLCRAAPAPGERSAGGALLPRPARAGATARSGPQRKGSGGRENHRPVADSNWLVAPTNPGSPTTTGLVKEAAVRTEVRKPPQPRAEFPPAHRRAERRGRRQHPTTPRATARGQRSPAPSADGFAGANHPPPAGARAVGLSWLRQGPARTITPGGKPGDWLGGALGPAPACASPLWSQLPVPARPGPPYGAQTRQADRQGAFGGGFLGGGALEEVRVCATAPAHDPGSGRARDAPFGRHPQRRA